MNKEIKEIKEKIEKGEKVYYTEFFIKSYSGSLVSGETRYFFITPDSNPIFHLSIQENRELGLMEEIDENEIVKVYKKSKGGGRGGYWWSESYVVAFSTRPFKVYLRHRGYTGNRCDDRDYVEEAKEIKSIEEFFKILE
ncbi:MAG: hypothetical protein QXI58_07265 [Candidatus Micrarchaeia archaeon]